MNNRLLILLVFFGALVFNACKPKDVDQDNSIQTSYSNIPAPQLLNGRIVAVHAHDTGAYTQGLQLHNGIMYEGTGDFKNSSLRVTDYKTGQVKEKHLMGTDKIFGEGITILNGKLYQLTWQNNIVYVYDLKNLAKPERTLNWPNEGWGITNDGQNLIVSDGSNILYTVNPADFKVMSTISVLDNKGKVDLLNELEYIKGFVYANRYTTNEIVKIDPESGHVVGKMVLNNLLSPQEIIPNYTDVLNGIAYDSTTNTMFVTGKRWPKLFEIKLD